MITADGINKKSSKARVYAITSGKGGVGKTSIALNLSIALSKAGLKVLLIDADMGYERATYFKKELLKLENAFDYIFIDTGAGISANVIDFVFMADEVLVIMNTEPTAFADAYAMVKVASTEKPSMSVGIIINMSKNEKDSERIFFKFNEIVNRFLGKEILYHGSIPVDKVVSEAVMRQIPLAIYAGKSSPMQSIRKIAKNLLGIENTKTTTIFNR